MTRHQRDRVLDDYFHEINEVILSRQHPISGLLPASTAVNAHGDYTDAWVRDNVYSIMAVWGLALAYRKLDNDNGRTYLLEQSVVKLMRGLLLAMMRQSDKVEKFKNVQSPENALHAKYDTQNGGIVVGDHEWGHLQLDATSLYILMLAQMSASGLRIIFTLDEVDFIQNLVHYIGRAYRTPDYGIWERGNKINHGLCELNASSIGMAKAALESIRGLNLFGPEGGSQSVIHVVADEIARTRSTLESLLPRESGSKEVDAALLSIISFPAFAVDNAEVAERTRHSIISKLKGRYGCKRFLLDGHQTVLEDPHRLHYEASELKQFEQIESEWPLFFTYLLLDALFRNDEAAINEYSSALAQLTVQQNGYDLLPELYYVAREDIAAEKAAPHSQKRLPNENVPLVWAQSLYYLGLMIREQLLSINDIDPLGRHWNINNRRSTSIQIALLAENETLQRRLLEHGIITQTLEQVAPIQIRTARELAEALYHLGENRKLGLTGRPLRRIRSLTTSVVFRIGTETVAFLPEFLNQREFYLNYDNKLLVEQFKSELLYHQHHWDIPGRPQIILLITAPMLYQEGLRDFLALIEQLQQGEVNGVPVRVGRLAELLPTAAKKHLDYLDNYQFAGPPQRIDSQPGFLLKWDALKCRPLSASQEQLINNESRPAELVARLSYSDNPYQQIKLLGRLKLLAGDDFDTGIGDHEKPARVSTLVEEVYRRAALNHVWSVVRQAAILLNKHDTGLEDAVTELVVRQKQLYIGRSYTPEALIKSPIANNEIIERITRFGGNDRREHILSEELLLALGTLIKAEPALFTNILTLRINHLITLLTNQLVSQHRVEQSEAFETLLQLRPYEIQVQLRRVLSSFSAASQQLFNLETLHYHGGADGIKRVAFKASEDPGAFGGHANWLSWREHNGVLSRMPESFYTSVWETLGHCHGITIGDRYERSNRLGSELRAEMTANEQNFAWGIEQLLNKIHAPEYRHLSIEALSTLGAIFKANPALKINDNIVIDVIIGHAVRQAWLEQHPETGNNYDQHKLHAWQAFYILPPHEVAEALFEAFIFLLTPGGSSEPTQSADNKNNH